MPPPQPSLQFASELRANLPEKPNLEDVRREERGRRTRPDLHSGSHRGGEQAGGAGFVNEAAEGEGREEEGRRGRFPAPQPAHPGSRLPEFSTHVLPPDVSGLADTPLPLPQPS
ncbi:hypothetical protein P7K49_033589 [Saguinus oedipus]|uniref:Uncharacterized protein n=1 Tax=Saguinus oedipus TaxID=9490 RepID=A0ABQ9TU35_SAGOE|nr:hypothetical protein P7K49_033589 [Saguinus oedipus]